MPRSDLLLWIDLEMSGLDVERERILEAAAILTDSELELVAEGPRLVVHQDAELLAAMDDWNREHHGESGLTDEVRSSTLSEGDAEERLLAFVREHCEPGTTPLAGNSIHHDRIFLRRYMPRLEAFFHYRNVDVSTVKELVRRWNPDVFDRAPAKTDKHRALEDIKESIEELRYYRRAVFRSPPS